MHTQRLGFFVFCNDIFHYHRYGDLVYILSQNSNETRKGPEFYRPNSCRAVYVGKTAQLISTNLYRTENTSSGVWLCDSCLIGQNAFWVSGPFEWS